MPNNGWGGNLGIGTITPGLVTGASSYMTIQSTNPSLELVGNTITGGTGVSKIDFINTASSVIGQGARIQSSLGVTATRTWQMDLIFSTNGSFGPGSATALSERMRILNTGTVGIGASSPLAVLDVRGGSQTNSLTLPVASFSGTTTFAGFVIDNSGVGDLFTASKSGSSRFTIAGNGSIIANAYVNCTLKTDTNGLFTCGVDNVGGGGAEVPFQELFGSIVPNNTTEDFLIGGQSSASARFSVTANNFGAGTLGVVGITGNTSFATLAVNNNGVGDLLTASSSGIPKFTISNLGNVFAQGALSASEEILGTSSASLITAYKGFSGYTNFSGGIGTGGIDSILGARRITSTGNLENIGSIDGGELLLTNAGLFTSHVDYSTNSGPRQIVVGDLNGDGEPDMAVVNYGNNSGTTVSVFINKGNGTFNAGVGYTTGTGPWDLAMGDLNGDGKADLVIINNNSGTFSVLINKGDGTFLPKVDYSESGGAGPRIAMGDLNGDGKADLVIANIGSTISVFMNKGDGTFYPKTDYTTTINNINVTIGDLNGDGKADLAVANNGSSVVDVLINNGNGTFAPKVSYTTGSASSGILIADLNNDNKLDIVTIPSNNSFSVLLNVGNGFATHQDYTTNVLSVFAAVGDLNGDGIPDLVISTTGAGGTGTTFSTYINTGNGTFGPKTDYTATGTDIEGIKLSDLNGDGKLDVAVIGVNSAVVSVFLNQSNPLLFAQAVTGRVGIGISSTPSATFDVRGTFPTKCRNIGCC